MILLLTRLLISLGGVWGIANRATNQLAFLYIPYWLLSFSQVTSLVRLKLFHPSICHLLIRSFIHHHSFIHSFLHLIFSIDLLFHSCEFNYLNQFNQPSFYLFVHHFSFICFSPLIHCVHLIISLLVLTTAICVLINLHLTGGVAKCQPNVYLELEKLASEVIKTRNIIVSINAFR